MLADSTGMTVLFSSGDNGDNFDSFGLSSADYPPSSPYVTAVGGTSLKIGANGQQTGQLGWATGRSFKCTANVVGGIPGCTKSAVGTWLPVTYDGGSGGFTSYNYTQPCYQAGVVPSSLALRNENILGPIPMRVEPDISMDADPATGFLIGLHETFPNGTVRVLPDPVRRDQPRLAASGGRDRRRGSGRGDCRRIHQPGDLQARRHGRRDRRHPARRQAGPGPRGPRQHLRGRGHGLHPVVP